MVDLHTHILPYLDDGASSYEEALEMLKIMVANGVTSVVATPHFDFEKNEVFEFLMKRNDTMEHLKAYVTELNLNIELLNGAELMFTPNLASYDLSDFTIEHTDYVLIELSTQRNEPNLEHTLSSIIASGFIPILAHIERYPYLIKDSQRVVKLIEMGALMQINASAQQTRKSKKMLKLLEKNNLVHIISSDAHNATNRKPNLKKEDISLEHINIQQKIIDNKTVIVRRPRKINTILRWLFM